MGYQAKIRSHGFSLVELAVATAIFSVGLSSLSLMMLTAVRGTDDAHHQTIAAAHADSLAEMIAMTADAFGHYVNPVPQNPLDCIELECAPDEMAASAMAAWRQAVGRDLPAGVGLVCRDARFNDGRPADPMCDNGGNLVIKLFWRDAGQAEGFGDLRRYVLRLPW
jgi:type IV pilus modification protein PilV